MACSSLAMSRWISSNHRANLRPKTVGLGVDAVRTPHAQGAAVFAGPQAQYLGQLHQPAHQYLAGLTQLQRQGGVQHVGEVMP
jgi:hypothetical protein